MNKKFNIGNNKKVRGAQRQIYNGVVFKSRLEVFFYKTALEEGLNFEYEAEKIILQDGFSFRKLRYFIPDTKNSRKDIILSDTKILALTYTPDFKLKIGDNIVIYVETKGFANDAYPMKRKLFLKKLNESNKQCYFFEPHTQKQCMQVIEIIKNISEVDYNKTINDLYKHCNDMDYDILKDLLYLHPKIFIDKLDTISRKKKYKEDILLKQFIRDLKIAW